MSRTSLPALVAAFCLLALLSARNGTHAQAPARGPSWECSFDDAQLPVVCAPPPSNGEARYITDIVVQSTDGLQDTLRIAAGTGISSGEPCGNNRVQLTIGTNGDPRLVAAPFDEAPTVMTPTTPLRVPPGLDVCIFPEQTLTIHILGYVAP